jgi:phosphoenolpyruvate carboxylase
MTFPHFRKVLDEREDPVDDRGHAPARRELIMNGLTRQQADDLRRTAEYLTLQMRLTPHPTERSRIRAMADTADYVAERIDALVSARQSVEQQPPRTPFYELLRSLPLGIHK